MSTTRVTVLMDEPIGTIHPELHGHFAEHLGTCIEGGVWVGDDCDTSRIDHIGGIRRDVVEALRAINPPVLRWPGGCFADDYHWPDGIGPRAKRPRTVNMHWGQTIETNGFGTHEFINFCRLIGAEPYLAGNLGSGTVREMRDWVEYCNFTGDSTLARTRGANGSPQPFGVRYWGVGNENWGCGGHMCPEDYAAEYRRYSTYLADFGDTKNYLIACGPDTGRKEFHADWTRRFFTKLGNHRKIHGFAAHYYCGTAGTATQYTTDQWYELLGKAMKIEDRIIAHRAIMDEFDRERKIGLIFDEWGTWHPPAPGRNPRHLWQQNTLRDALVAAISLDAFHRHADKIVMANIAQTVNVLQAMILTEEEKMLLTPTYHVFDLYQPHKGGQSVRFEVPTDIISYAVGDEKRSLPALSGSASVRDGALTISLVNAHANLPAEVAIDVRGADVSTVEASSLRHEQITAFNSFDDPGAVTPSEPQRSEVTGEWRVTLPPASVNVFEART
jgi:alpha-N-arabinofuranosidase